jgi:serine/threonine protein kinase
MNICPTCQQCFEDVHALCAHDQTPLVASRPGACVIGKKYSLDQLLDQDLSTSVYAGTLLEADRPVAITLLRTRSVADSDALVRFRREAHTIAHLNTRVNHQHVARTFDYGSLPDGGEAFIVTELVAGQTLREHMDEAGQLPFADAVHIARQIVEGLDAAHRCGVVHRDLNPANIILGRNSYKRFEVKIIDFGLARLREQRTLLPATDGAHNHAALNPLSALAPYVSPEQHVGEEPDGRSDLYSLGVILYEMLAGRLPFDNSAANIDAASDSEKKEEQPLPLSDVRADVPESLVQLVMQSLQSKRSSRPYSAAEFARLLRMDEHPATQLKLNVATPTAVPVASDADTATAHPNDTRAMKAVFSSDNALPPAAAASVLSAFVPSETTPPQQQSHVELEPELQPQRAVVFQETIAPIVENRSEAQESDPAPRKIIIYFDNETIFAEREWDEEEASASSHAPASPFVAESAPTAVPSAAPAKRRSEAMRAEEGGANSFRRTHRCPHPRRPRQPHLLNRLRLLHQ